MSCVPQTTTQYTSVPATAPIVETSPTVLPQDVIAGIVFDENGPVPGATVRIQTTENHAFTDCEGHFTLEGLSSGIPVTVSAWKEGYYCAKVEGISPPTNEIELFLRRYQSNDNPDYEWGSPSIGDESCFSCKPGLTQVWLDNDAHGKSALNPRFITMYNGTDVEGNQSPLTRFAFNRDYGRVPIPPDMNQPYYGPGYRLDFPDTDGNCAACHTPGAALANPYQVDPTEVSGVDEFGIHCDFCHKIADVRLNPQTGMPYPNMPGVLSLDILRPFPEDEERFQLFFGTFDDDNVPEEDTLLPLIRESQYCASCHFGVFWDIVIYNSYGEWLESPYSDPETGQTCQDCHMPAPTILDGEVMINIAPGKEGVERDPMTIHAHTFPGAADVELLQNAVTMKATGHSEGEQIVVEVRITNDLTGHHVPTDSPLRHLILLVKATDAEGNPLERIDGPTIPEWCGVGDPQDGYYGGLPGKAFAKVLSELWTETSPSGAYWNPTRIQSDNRLAAFTTDTSSYIFNAPQTGSVEVQVKLIYRRAFIELMDQKGWDVPDIIMEGITLEYP